jgi:hypothetical protein
VLRRLLYAIFLTGAVFALFSCATRVVYVPISTDEVVLEQRDEIERQREIIGELERVIRTGAEHLAEAESIIVGLEAGSIDFADWLQRVDTFVRRVIAVQRLFDAVQ